jgi:hypothetical protein
MAIRMTRLALHQDDHMEGKPVGGRDVHRGIEGVLFQLVDEIERRREIWINRNVFKDEARPRL